MWKNLFLFLLLILFFTISHAQDTLPNISVKNVSGRVIISWKNNYGIHINNINIQRSYDSLRNFTTFSTVLNPSNKENGVVDQRPFDGKVFYRVFVAFEGGTYIFSRSHKPVTDTIQVDNTPSKLNPADDIPKIITDTGSQLKLYTFIPRDIKIITPAKAVIKSIYTGKDNNVIINLLGALTHKYSIKFFDDNQDQILEVDKVSETYLILDKVNFRHSGLFHYELYDEGILIENNKFFISKDSKVSNGN
jgi:hypothetical protein